MRRSSVAGAPGNLGAVDSRLRSERPGCMAWSGMVATPLPGPAV